MDFTIGVSVICYILHGPLETNDIPALVFLYVEGIKI